MNILDLVVAFKELGISPGDYVLTHSSLKSIGHVEGGAATVVAALREAVGREGAALFPTHTWGPNQNPGNPPAFDARTSPSVVGLVSETARTMPGAIRSLSPTHSVVAFGAKAEWICGAHQLSETPCGVHSPYERLCAVEGRILLLGCDHECNTTLHMVEELAGLPYHMIPGYAEYAVTGTDGEPVVIRARFHAWGSPRCFNRIEPMLVEAGAQVSGKVGEATARLIDAAKMRDLVLDRLKADPDFLIAADC